MVNSIRTTAALLIALSGHSVNATEILRDPFLKLSEMPEPPKIKALTLQQTDKVDTNQLKLKAILWGEQPLANISGMIVAPGDKIYGYLLKSITRTHATLSGDGQPVVLTLEKDD